MSTIQKKADILKENNYTYNFDRAIYYNISERKIFSVEAIVDNDEDWLRKRIKEEASIEWKFYFKSPPNDEIRQEIIEPLK